MSVLLMYDDVIAILSLIWFIWLSEGWGSAGSAKGNSRPLESQSTATGRFGQECFLAIGCLFLINTAYYCPELGVPFITISLRRQLFQDSDSGKDSSRYFQGGKGLCPI
jgi:hypothetical protein